MSFCPQKLFTTRAEGREADAGGSAEAAWHGPSRATTHKPRGGFLGVGQIANAVRDGISREEADLSLVRETIVAVNRPFDFIIPVRRFGTAASRSCHRCAYPTLSHEGWAAVRAWNVLM